MMQLGTIIRGLEDETDAASTLEELGDIALLVAVEDMGERYGETPGGYVSGAARRFANLASDEDWVALMGAMKRVDDPARGALDHMVRWSLARDAREQAGDLGAAGCTCSAGGAHGHDDA